MPAGHNIPGEYLKKVAGNYKYHLTAVGRAVASLALQLRAFLVTPTLTKLAPAPAGS